LITITGWTWEYVGKHMTIPRLNKMTEYWDRHPPVHLMVAGFMGYEGEAPAQKVGPDNPGKLSDLVREFGALGGIVEHKNG
jgi:hypothetical protein